MGPISSSTCQLSALAGARVDACDAQGRCALAVAVQSCACRTVERLLAAGADLTVADAGGRTALHYAAQKGALRGHAAMAQGVQGKVIQRRGVFHRAHIISLHSSLKRQQSCIDVV